MTYRYYIFKIARVHNNDIGEFVTFARNDKSLPQTAIEIGLYISDRYSRNLSASERKCYNNYRSYCMGNNIKLETRNRFPYKKDAT